MTFVAVTFPTSCGAQLKSDDVVAAHLAVEGYIPHFVWGLIEKDAA